MPLLAGIFVLVAVVISILTAINYHPVLKISWWYYPISFVFGNCLTFLWWWLMAAVGRDDKKVFFSGLIWDVVLTGMSLLIPVLYFDVRPNRLAAWGVALIVAGLVLLKFGHD
jgi:hypothetical protein